MSARVNNRFRYDHSWQARVAMVGIRTERRIGRALDYWEWKRLERGSEPDPLNARRIMLASGDYRMARFVVSEVVYLGFEKVTK